MAVQTVLTTQLTTKKERLVQSILIYMEEISHIAPESYGDGCELLSRSRSQMLLSQAATRYYESVKEIFGTCDAFSIETASYLWTLINGLFEVEEEERYEYCKEAIEEFI